jgi:hypothetical protein
MSVVSVMSQNCTRIGALRSARHTVGEAVWSRRKHLHETLAHRNNGRHAAYILTLLWERDYTKSLKMFYS